MRKLAHGMKLGNMAAMVRGADMMAPLIPKNAVLVPMPNHEGTPIRTMMLGYCISGVRDDLDVVPALLAEPHDGSYHDKKAGRRPSVKMMRDERVRIPEGRPVVVIDNVIASGATWEAAQKVLPNATLVTLADASRGRNEAQTLSKFFENAEGMSNAAFVRRFGSRNIDEGLRFKRSVDEVSNKFDKDLQDQIDGNLPKDYVYNLGLPSDILRTTERILSLDCLFVLLLAEMSLRSTASERFIRKTTTSG